MAIDCPVCVAVTRASATTVQRWYLEFCYEDWIAVAGKIAWTQYDPMLEAIRVRDR